MVIGGSANSGGGTDYLSILVHFNAHNHGAGFIAFLYKFFLDQCFSSSKLIIAIAIQAFPRSIITTCVWVAIGIAFVPWICVIAFATRGSPVCFWSVQNV